MPSKKSDLFSSKEIELFSEMGDQDIEEIFQNFDLLLSEKYLIQDFCQAKEPV